MRRHSRDEELACRVDAETFALVMPAVSAGEANDRAQAIKGAFRSLRVRSGPLEIAAVLNAGVAVFPADAAGLLAAAKRALGARA